MWGLPTLLILSLWVKQISKLIFNLSHWEDIKLLSLMNVGGLFSHWNLPGTISPKVEADILLMVFHLSLRYSALSIVTCSFQSDQINNEILQCSTVQTRVQPILTFDSRSFSLQLAMTFKMGQYLSCKTPHPIISERYTRGEDLPCQLALRPAKAQSSCLFLAQQANRLAS